MIEVQQTGALEPQFREIVSKAIDKTAFIDTTTAGVDEEFSIEHGLGFIPIGYVVIGRGRTVSIYNGTTPWDTNRIYLKGNDTTVAIRVLIF